MPSSACPRRSFRQVRTIAVEGGEGEDVHVVHYPKVKNKDVKVSQYGGEVF